MVCSHKTFYYKIYPTVVQKKQLVEWEDALRWVWNHWVDQRRQMAQAGRYPAAPGPQAGRTCQTYELPALKRVHTWLNGPPAKAYLAMADRLHKAWKSCWEGRARPPRFKKRGRDGVSISVDQIPENVVFRDEQGRVRLKFPKLGNVRLVYHRPIAGRPKVATISRKRDEWFVSIVCETAPIVAKSGPTIGIDRGVIDAIADSDGRLVASPAYLCRSLKRLRILQRRVSRREHRGQADSGRCARARKAVATLHAHIAEQRKNWLHNQSRYYADRAGHVVVEDLKIANMVKGNLARQILDQGWGALVTQLEQKMASGCVIKVAPHYTSQTCSACGVIDERARRGKKYRCLACGHEDDADINAAKEIRRRGIETLTAQAVEQAARAEQPGRNKRRNARAACVNGQKLGEMRAGVVTSKFVAGLVPVKCSESGHNLEGNFQTCLVGQLAAERCSKTSSQGLEIIKGVQGPCQQVTG